MKLGSKILIIALFSFLLNFFRNPEEIENSTVIDYKESISLEFPKIDTPEEIKYIKEEASYTSSLIEESKKELKEIEELLLKKEQEEKTDSLNIRIVENTTQNNL